ncbi:energy transducer TonB [candidate division KSB1 bacterium]|nr:energy transducer TonB [candidate division KSB1 bacterium]
MPESYAEQIAVRDRQASKDVDNATDASPKAGVQRSRPSSPQRSDLGWGVASAAPLEAISAAEERSESFQNDQVSAYADHPAEDGTETASEQGVWAVVENIGTPSSRDELSDIIGQEAIAEQEYQRIFQNLHQLSESEPFSGGGSSSEHSSDEAHQVAARGQRTTAGGGIDGLINGLDPGLNINMQKTEAIAAPELVSLSDDGTELTGKNNINARDVDRVRAIVHAHSTSIQYCYERERQGQPHLKGKVVIRFTILPSGKVTDARLLSSSLNNETVERCILSRISRWDDFGAVDDQLGNTTFRQTYSFGY